MWCELYLLAKLPYPLLPSYKGICEMQVISINEISLADMELEEIRSLTVGTEGT